jgi:hypothetical protein
LYDQNSELVTRAGRHLIDVSLNRVGVIDSRGVYHSLTGKIVVPFRVVHRLGQWRITHLPPGVLLSTADAQRSLQPADLFYLNLPQNHVVPVPILMRLDKPGIATTLVRALLDKPAGSIAASTLTAAPEGLALLGNVPIDPDGVAEINLSGELQQASTVTLQRLSAQIVWTLRQVPGVTAVRLLDNGTPLTDVGVAGVQPAAAWRQFDPNVPPATRGALVSDRGVVEGIGRSAPDALDGRRLRDPIVSADGATVAALHRAGGRMTLVVGSTISEMHPRLTATALSSPAFAPSGAVFVVRGSGSGTGLQSTLAEVPTHGPVQTVDLPPQVATQGVSAVAISRDGSRVALTVGPPGHSSLVVGSLSAVHGTPTIAGVSTLVTGDRDARVFATSIDGYRGHFVPRTGLPRNVDQVAAAPGQPLLAANPGGVWARTSGHWRRASTGREPSYAG